MALGRRAYIGLELSVQPGVERSEQAEPGLLVEHVDAEGPSERARVRSGDRVLAIAGQRLVELDQARRLVAALPHEQPVSLELTRAGRTSLLQVISAPLPREQLPVGRIELDEVRWGAYRLRAIWSFPEQPPPHPLIWLLPGATWLSDEHPTTPLHPLRKLVEQFTASGFATLRVERSGLGDSEGPPCSELDLEAELAGFRAAFAGIDAHPALRHDGIFAFGRSLGGMLLPLVLAGRKLAGAAVWGTSSRRWSDAMLRASVRQWTLHGQPDLEPRRERLRALHELVYERGLRPEQAFEQRPDLRGLLPGAFTGSHVYGRVARYFQQLQARDLEQAFRQLDAPLLALHGSCDWLSEWQDLVRIAELCAPASERLQLPGIDHLLHQRESLEQAFATLWGGSYSPIGGARPCCGCRSCPHPWQVRRARRLRSWPRRRRAPSRRPSCACRRRRPLRGCQCTRSLPAMRSERRTPPPATRPWPAAATATVRRHAWRSARPRRTGTRFRSYARAANTQDTALGKFWTCRLPSWFGVTPASVRTPLSKRMPAHGSARDCVLTCA
ncbi:MAG TPA: PDZ domain-containing protein [Polyangiales bacterium]|nr:PDZ domain-containing protein [Polyangiales bacterium]